MLHCLPTIKPSPDAFFTSVHSLKLFALSFLPFPTQRDDVLCIMSKMTISASSCIFHICSQSPLLKLHSRIFCSTGNCSHPQPSMEKWAIFAEDFERLIFHLYHCLLTIKPSPDAFSKIHICSQAAAPCVVFPSFSLNFCFVSIN